LKPTIAFNGIHPILLYRSYESVFSVYSIMLMSRC
jgi:hypothetical protein